MKIDDDVAQTYPQLANFLRTSLPFVIAKGRVWKAYTRSVDTGGKQWKSAAQGAVLWGQGPTLHVEDLNRYYLATREVGEINGQFSPAYPNRVYLSDVIAAQFETDHQLPAAKVCVESTLLHELVHWSNHWTGKRLLVRRTKSGRQVNHESGKSFEIEAYGEDQGRWF